MKLTDDQKKVKEAIKQFYINDEKFLTINGSAGTGKTTVLKEVFESMENYQKTIKLIDPNYVHKYVRLTATTNKAVSVLQAQLIGHPHPLDVCTIHKLLSLRVSSGKSIPSAFIDNVRQELQGLVIVIDECSMIDDDLCSYIIQVAEGGNTKFIFVGDSNQLPPVKQKYISQVFSVNTITLKQVVRQQDKLLQVVDSFREYAETGKEPVFDIDGTNVLHLNQQDFDAMVLADMSKPSWTNLDSRVLAYTNKAVTHYNDLIKEIITGSSNIKAGELVINNVYVRGNPAINVPTEAQVFVRSIRPHYFCVDGFVYDIEFNNKFTSVWMPKDIDAMKELDKKYKGKPYPTSLQRMLADLRPLYASTIHKAQGSTFERIYIDLNSIKPVKHYDIEMFKRLLYVAVSRASKQIIFTGSL